ncbi:MAG: MMPL family transporter [Acidobacteriota bacterium]|nr:MMPL family transporter [Acidobacteriota bacterium]
MPPEFSMQKWSSELLQHPGRVLGFFLLLAALAVPGLLRLGLDNSPEVFFVRDADALERYRQLEFDFGRDRAVRLVARGDGLWTAEGLAWLGQLEERAARLRGVIHGAGLFGHHGWRLDSWPPEGRLGAATFRQQVLDDPVDRRAGWVSGDGEVATVLVALYKLTPKQQRQALDELAALVAEPPPGVETFLAGLPVVERAIDGALLQMVKIFFPLLAVLAVLLLGAVFRSWRLALLPLALVMLCEMVIFGTMGWLGVPLDMVGIILAPLLFVVTLATAVHLQMRFLTERRAGLSAPDAARAMVHHKAWPVVWTGVTTAVGFGSLALAPVPAVQRLGWASLAAFLLMTVAALSFFPALLLRASGTDESIRKTVAAKSLPRRAWGAWVVRHRRQVGVCFALLALVALAGLPRLRMASGFLEYFRPEHPVRAQLEQLTERGMGVLAAELVLTRDDGARFDTPAGAQALAALAEELRAQESRGQEPLQESMVLEVLGAGDLVAGIGRYLQPTGDPETEADWEAALRKLRSVPEHERMLGYFVTADGQRARLTLWVPMAGYAALEPTLERARAAALRAFPGAEAEITGRYPMVLSARRALLYTLWTSFAVTLLWVALILRGSLHSIGLALRALLPNLWPVAVVLGAMGWLGIEVDATTVMIAAAVLGLAVDDTFHSLGSFRRHLAAAELRGPVTTAEAARRALDELARPHLVTSVVLTAGFGVCALSSFLPMARFGALMALAVLAALAADLWLVPALLAGASEEEAARLRSDRGV